MTTVVVVAYFDRLWLPGADRSTAVSYPWDDRPLQSALRERLVAPGLQVVAGSVVLATRLSEELDRKVAVASLGELRAARAKIPLPPPAEERTRVLAVAHEALAKALRDPEEVLITLAREEERLERAVGREARAAESFYEVPEPSVREFLRRWADVRASLGAHHATLERLIAERARAVAPNLSALLGERTAARLVAEAGGVAALARMRAGRIQLLGSRRRPSPERGPRYGLVFRADGMAEVPPGRRGAYARSLAALAAIAARADGSTRSSIADKLVARRDRRIEQLRSRKG